MSRAARLRVCHVLSADLWAGAEVQVATLASYLAECPEVRLSVVVFNDGPLACELRRRGIDVVVISERDHHAFRIVALLAAHFRARRVEIVHTHRYKDNLLATVAAKIARVPHIIRTVHGLTEPMRGWARLKYRALETIDRLALSNFADVVIAVSRHTAAALRQSGYRPPSLRPIHNGIDMANVRAVRSRHAVRRELGIAPEAVLIGTAARLTAVKAQDDLLHAARLMLDQRPDFRFVVVGDGPEESRLKAIAADAGIGDRVVFTGARRDVPDLVAAMDVFVLSSLDEGMPMALLEAMTLGTPVVATAVGGVTELIEHDANGLLVPARDPRALADACIALASNPRSALALAARARETIERGFSREANGAQVLDTYRAVAVAGGEASPAPTRNGAGVLDLCRSLIVGLAWHVGRGVERVVTTAAARRQVRTLRRNPAPLTRALRSAHRILIVCQGNIIRSPFAARLVEQALRARGEVSVTSAGLSAVAGRPPHPTAVPIALTRSVDLTGHAASPLDAEAVRTSDVIFVMDIAQLVAMHQRFPDAKARTFLLTSLAFDAELEIADPVDGDESRFQVCFDHISRAVRPIVSMLCSVPTTR